MYKLLIVDDNVYERNGIAKLKVWQELGFNDVLLAENGKKGYELAIKEKP
jgi:two-component system response regulator YesN